MKLTKTLKLGSFILGMLGTQAAIAEVSVDLVPKRVVLHKSLVDDISNRYEQHIYVYVANYGTRDFRTNRRLMSVNINGRTYRGYIYGPDSHHGTLGGPIPSGSEGKVIVSAPVDTYDHCQKLDIHIDTARNFQATTSGRDVFANDRKTLMATDAGTRTICVDLPLPRERLPRHPLPRIPLP